MLHSRYLVSSCSIVLCKLCFNNDTRVELVRHDEIRGLVETADALRPLSLPKTDTCIGKYCLNGRLNHISNQFGNAITMTGERPTKKPFVENHGIWYSKVCERLDACKPARGVSFVKTM